jgi:REP element-mobilizing transposase RayT
MSRPLRIQYRGASYHITCRGIRKDPIYFDDRDRLKFIEKINETAAKYSFIVYAYCLMPNHYHLFLQTPLANLSEGVHQLNGAYASWLRCKRKLVGHIFQGRFKSILVEEETYAINLSLYIHLNPCRWKLVERPEDYAWSSCRDYLGMRGSRTPALRPDRILDMFGRDLVSARRRYHEMLIEKRDMEDPLKGAYRRLALGSPAFIDKIRKIVNERATAIITRELPARALGACRAVSPDQVFEAIQAVAGCSLPEILKKKRGQPWRPMGMYLVKKYCAIGLRKAGEIWGTDYAAISINVARFISAMKADTKLAELVGSVDAKIHSGYDTGGAGMEPALQPDSSNTAGSHPRKEKC